jgi:hypothetical protein
MAMKATVSVVLLALLFSRVNPSGLLAKMRGASLGWLAAAMGLYLLMILASAWRWRWLFAAQRLAVSGRKLVHSYLVATFFNNFLPSNIGGDVVRIRDTADAAGSRTLAATIVLIDRAIGLTGLLFVAAVGASVARLSGTSDAVPVWPAVLWGGFVLLTTALLVVVLRPGLTTRLLAPLRRFDAQWVDVRLARITAAFVRFGERPAALLWCLAGAVLVQMVLVGFYAAVAQSIGIPIAMRHLAVLVPVSFVVQMLPISVNGFGVREATFSYYVLRLGLPMDSALALSLLSTGTVLAFSLSGAVVYATRR